MICQRLVDRQRGLGDVGDLVRVRDLEVVHVLGCLHEHDAGRRLAGGPLHLLVARVADQHDRVALLRELARLDVDLGDQRTGGVDRAQAPPFRVLVHLRGDAVCGEDDQLALRDLGLLVDEDRAPLGELLDDVLVVDDLLAHVYRRAVQLQGLLDRLHGSVDAGAVAARGGQQDAPGNGATRGLGGGSHGLRVPSLGLSTEGRRPWLRALRTRMTLGPYKGRKVERPLSESAAARRAPSPPPRPGSLAQT